jgi:hypothetical protein
MRFTTAGPLLFNDTLFLNPEIAGSNPILQPMTDLQETIESMSELRFKFKACLLARTNPGGPVAIFT